jgi:predicted O-linked N-acetylglucosamine transferase (SPINDLY family)
MKILDKCKNSVLWLLKENEKSAENLIKEAKKRGINKERIIFAERTSLEIHLKRFEFIDLFLDTYPYGAHTTASEAVRMGIPVLTMMGKSFASRVAGSILINVGLEKLVTKNINEYSKIAIEIALDRNKLAKLKAHLANQNNTDNLFNSKKFTKDLENIFLNLIKDKI